MKKKLRRNDSRDKSFKTIIIILTFLILIGLLHMYRISDRSKGLILALQSQKASTLKELKFSESKLNKMNVSNSELSEQLILERKKIKKLIAEFQNSNVSEILNLKFQKQAQALQNNVFFLTKQLEEYKKKADTVSKILVVVKKSNDELLTQNKDLIDNNKSLSSKIDEATALSYFDFQVVPYKIGGFSGKLTETENASKVDLLKVSFTIAENKLSKTKHKKYYIQIIDSKNNVLGQKKSVNFDDKTLEYSAIDNIKYENKALTIEKELTVTDLEEGTFRANIFDNSNLILSSSFVLK
jgi:predicted RNase H-like nuclease (RuvC/YqgF family)